jgi:hypothetical protein
MYCLSSNVLSGRTDNTLEDRKYIERQTIHWRTDNTLEDRQYIEEDRQYIVDRQYIEGQTIH